MNNKGKVSAGQLLIVVILVIVGYIAIKIVPVYINYYEIENMFEQSAGTYLKQSPSDIYNEIVRKLEEIHHPCDPRLVSISTEPNAITISAQYTEVVEFIGGYRLSFTFSPKVTKVVR